MSRRYEHSHGFVYFVSLDVCLTTLSLAMFIKVLLLHLWNNYALLASSSRFVWCKSDLIPHLWACKSTVVYGQIFWLYLPWTSWKWHWSSCSGRNNHVIKLQNLLFVSALFKEPLKTKLYAWQRNSFIIQTIKYRSVGTYTINSAQSSTVMCVWSFTWYPCIEHT